MGLLRRLVGLFGGGAPRPASNARLPPTQDEPDTPSMETFIRGSEAERIVYEVCDEALTAARHGQVKLSDSVRWKRVKDDPAELQIGVLLVALHERPHRPRRRWEVETVCKAMVAQLLRRNLPFSDAHLVALLGAWQGQQFLEYGLPGPTMLGAVERRANGGAELSADLKAVLAKLRSRAQRGYYGQQPNSAMRSAIQRIDALLDPSGATERPLPAGAFAKRFDQHLASAPEADRGYWLALARHAVDARDKSKPTRAWLDKAALATTGMDRSSLANGVLRLMEDTTPDPARPDDSLDILRGLVWISTRFDHGEMAGPVGRFAETCFRKVPNVGARSVKLGNAALWALSEMAGEPRAAAELFRLRQKIKYPSTQKAITGRLAELAQASGQTVEGMEDLSLPDYGLDGRSRLTAEFGGARAELRLSATGAEASWFSGGGKSVKSPPTEVRAQHRDLLAAFQRQLKEIDDARAAQALRLEQSWLETRSWSLAEWRSRYLGHPLRRPIVEGLIWRIGSCAVMPVGGELVDVGGRAQLFPDDAHVTLWHPLDGEPQEVLDWRGRILELGLTQPIKQAHREIYVLTDAERRTGVYSNRFAAHILRQHQFRALCQARGWAYELMGGWDNWNMPSRRLPGHGLSVEYLVEVADDGQQSASGVSLHLASDQVRFLDPRGQPVSLETISPIVFSEVLRDVDLFVAVTSVANDPGWTDGGPDGRHGQYWREWAFGELGQSAQTRRELVAWIAPRLSIADRLEVTPKFLVVQGKRQRYAIHFGSGNIQILPSNRYLCIVPDRPPAETSELRLPFTGDGTLSAILAKAFLLVDESKIRDPTILQQL